MKRDNKGRNIGYTNEEFLKIVKEKLDYIEILDEYKGTKEKVRYKCLKCGYINSKRAGNLIEGHGCPHCKALNDRLSHSDFIERMKNINPFLEIIGEYKTCTTPLEARCSVCGKIFSTKPEGLLRKTGCPYCNLSKGERDVSIFLDRNCIKYVQQKKYDDLTGLGGGKLAYDFYLPDYNLLVEYQGKQHCEPIKGFVEGERFEHVKEHDYRKKKYAEKHNIQLLEIWYNENIEQKLKETLNLETVETAGV